MCSSSGTGADLEHLVDLLLILDDGEADLGVLQHEEPSPGHRILVHRHRHAAQALAAAHIDQYRRGRLSPTMARLSPRLKPSSARPQAMARTFSATCAQVQVCQMPYPSRASPALFQPRCRGNRLSFMPTSLYSRQAAGQPAKPESRSDLRARRAPFDASQFSHSTGL
jgi:hypothetical protein